VKPSADVNFQSEDRLRQKFHFGGEIERSIDQMTQTLPQQDFKVVVLGAMSVGKTCIIQRYCNNIFQDGTLATIGVGFFAHAVEHQGTEITLMIWDTAGEERFRSVAPSLLRGTNGLILVYDRSNAHSFNDLDIYLDFFLDVVDVNHMAVMPILLLGNKSDLPDIAVSDATVQQWLRKNRIRLAFNTSARTGEGIQRAFAALIDILVAPGQFAEGDMPPRVIAPTQERSFFNGCC
jgi:small GTP-binding protein